MRKEISYISDDGKKFTRKKDCEAHEEWLKTKEGELLNPSTFKKKMQFFTANGREIENPHTHWNDVIVISILEKDKELFDIVNAVDTKFTGSKYKNPFPEGKEIAIPSLLHFNGYRWVDYDDTLQAVKNDVLRVQRNLDFLLDVKKKILEAALDENI